VRTRVATATGVCIAVLMVGSMVLWQRFAANLPLTLPASRTCVVTASAGSAAGGDGQTDVSVDGAQMANAATISAIGIRRGVPPRAVVVALATAFQESKLENLDHGDRDSIGLFQQRPSQGWGTPKQLSDPRYAANAFYSALLKVPGWQRMRVTDAAQAVQRSAHPEAYERWVDKAEVLTGALTGGASGAVACVVAGQPDQRGAAAAQALESNVRLDWGDVRSVTVGDVPGLTLAAPTSRVGWQYAHWMVAHAEERGIKRVRFADREWTAKSGAWGYLDTARTDGRVVAEVYPT
jgi:hypothetical protein